MNPQQGGSTGSAYYWKLSFGWFALELHVRGIGMFNWVFKKGFRNSAPAQLTLPWGAWKFGHIWLFLEATTFPLPFCYVHFLCIQIMLGLCPRLKIKTSESLSSQHPSTLTKKTASAFPSFLLNVVETPSLYLVRRTGGWLCGPGSGKLSPAHHWNRVEGGPVLKAAGPHTSYCHPLSAEAPPK